MSKYKFGSKVVPWESFEAPYVPTDEEKKELKKIARHKAKLEANNQAWNQNKPSSLIADLETKPIMDDLPF